jgi:hypothetical protein
VIHTIGRVTASSMAQPFLNRLSSADNEIPFWRAIIKAGCPSVVCSKANFLRITKHSRGKPRPITRGGASIETMGGFNLKDAGEVIVVPIRKGSSAISPPYSHQTTLIVAQARIDGTRLVTAAFEELI